MNITIPAGGKILSAKSFRRDILEGYVNGSPVFSYTYTHKTARYSLPLSPLEGIFYVGISKTYEIMHLTQG